MDKAQLIQGWNKNMQDLAVKAANHELTLARQLWHELYLKNKNDDLIIKYKAPSREFLKQYLLRELFPYNTSVQAKYTQTGQFRVLQADYIINGQVYHLDENDIRHEEIHSIYNAYLGERNESDPNWETRLTGIIWEKAGETILQSMFPDRGLEQNVEKAQKNKADSVLNLLINIPDEYSGQDIKKSNWGIHTVGLRKYFFEHKDRLDRFHFASGNVVFEPETILHRLSILNLPQVIQLNLIHDKVSGEWPIYYSVNTKDVLLCSEILNTNMEHWDLKEPDIPTRAEIIEQARRIYSVIESNNSDKDLVTQVGRIIGKMTVKGNLWYVR